mgnify:CR=1 FL=1
MTKICYNYFNKPKILLYIILSTRRSLCHTKIKSFVQIFHILLRRILDFCLLFETTSIVIDIQVKASTDLPNIACIVTH